MGITKYDSLWFLLSEGDLVLVTAEALTPPSGLGKVYDVSEEFLTLDPPNLKDDDELITERNLMPVLFRTIVPRKTIKLILQLRTNTEPSKENGRSEETT